MTGAAGDRQRTRALEELVEVGRTLDATIVGAGCDSEADLRLLLELGCDRIHGAFVAEPMPADELPAWAAGSDPSRLGGWEA